VIAGKLLGIDFGTVRVGLAISDPDHKFAFPLETFQRRGQLQEAAHLRALIVEEQVMGLVVGLPLHNDGREGIKAAEARAYGTWLATITGLPIIYWDERFTTIEAESALWQAGLTHKKRRERRDRVAAQILLQNYLDAGAPADSSAPEPLQSAEGEVNL
jgi:putative holliday junction resolvase